MRPLLLALLIAGPVQAADSSNYLSPDVGTTPVAQQGGDTPNTYTVSLSSSAATVLRPAVTNRSRRKVCFQNRSSFLVNIGTSTVVGSDLWTVGESTNAATVPIYCSDGPGAYLGYISNSAAGGAASAATVQVIEEVQSVP